MLTNSLDALASCAALCDVLGGHEPAPELVDEAVLLSGSLFLGSRLLEQNVLELLTAGDPGPFDATAEVARTLRRGSDALRRGLQSRDDWAQALALAAS